MKRLNGNISSSQGSLEERPEVFDSLSVYLPFDIGLGMVHNVMHEPIADFGVSVPLIGVDRGTTLDRGQNFLLQGFTLDVGNHLGANLANVAVQHSHHNGLALRSGNHVVTSTLGFVHVLERSANKRFVHFDRARFSSAQLGEGAIPQGEAQTVQDEPCRLLSNADSFGNLVGRNTVLAVNQHPQGSEPFVQRDGRVLEDRSHFDGELATALLALPSLLGCEVVMVLADALRAGGNPIRPSKVGYCVDTDVFVREMPDSLLKGLDLRVHDPNVAKSSWLVKSIITCRPRAQQGFQRGGGGGVPRFSA